MIRDITIGRYYDSESVIHRMDPRTKLMGVLVYIISLFLDRFLALTYVAHAFHGIQVCVVYLIITAGLRMLRSLERDPVSLCILLGVGMGMLLCTLFAVSFSSVYYILLSGAVGILAGKIRRICRKEGKP